jgi:hypothetical protein
LFLGSNDYSFFSGIMDILHERDETLSNNSDEAILKRGLAFLVLPPYITSVVAMGYLAATIKFESIQFRLDKDIVGVTYELRDGSDCHVSFGHPHTNNHDLHTFCSSPSNIYDTLIANIVK